MDSSSSADLKTGNERSISNQLPIRLTSTVIRGFGRGSKDLGIPTANLCREHLKCKKMSFDSLPTGIYWGFARIIASESGSESAASVKDYKEETIETEEGSSSSASSSLPLSHNPAHDNQIYKAAISIGYNPVYGNRDKTIEPHLIAPANNPNRNKSKCKETQFNDFYGSTLRLSIVGYLRPELPFEGLEKLIEAIKGDIVQTERLADIEKDMVEGNNDDSKGGDENLEESDPRRTLASEESRWVGSEEEE
mmetsp:Transcript_14854/g.22507  ORF Transcript_14854/g.22507 Transcript_14854/m.22507 type:complete len:251 (-) Transcript_14854:91-843(-)